MKFSSSSYQQNPRAVFIAGLLAAGLYSVGLFELGRELGQVESEEAFSLRARRLRESLRRLKDCGGHPRKMYGHVHMAKTGGTSLNGILANRFERVCGNKDNSFEAYHHNSLAAAEAERGVVHPEGPRGHERMELVESVGYEDCDYVSEEASHPHSFWVEQFGEGKFHGLEMELHVPCREPIDHLMSQCNFVWRKGGEPKRLACDAEADGEFLESVEACFVRVRERFRRELEEHFDVKCYDFRQQFTGYVDVMAERLEDKRLVPDRYVKRETNDPRDRESECIWKRPDLMEKTRQYLVKNVDYYGFCDRCLGSEDDLTFGRESAPLISN